MSKLRFRIYYTPLDKLPLGHEYIFGTFDAVREIGNVKFTLDPMNIVNTLAARADVAGVRVEEVIE